MGMLGLAACVGAAACAVVVLLGRLAVLPTTAETRPQIQAALAAGVLPRIVYSAAMDPGGTGPATILTRLARESRSSAR
jgi:hypothetical protein